MRGVKMVVEQGCTQARVAEILGVGERQVRRWMKRYRRGGYRALAKQTRGRRATEQMALTAREQDKLVKMIKSKHPEQLRIPGTLWTRAGVGDLIERECGVRLEITTVGRYIERWGFTLKRPTKRMLEADPEVVEAWLSEVYPQIKARAAREHGLIFWQDESGIRLQQLTPLAGYAPRGQRAVARVSGKRVSANMVSALANSGKLHFSVFDGRFNATLFIEFLERLIRAYPDRKVFVICDNATTHHAQIVKQWVTANSERIELHYLPSYSPHLNPDEYLNQDLKRHMRQLYPRPADKPSLKDAVHNFLLKRKRQPTIVRNYFRERHVAYAA